MKRSILDQRPRRRRRSFGKGAWLLLGVLLFMAAGLFVYREFSHRDIEPEPVERPRRSGRIVFLPPERGVLVVEVSEADTAAILWVDIEPDERPMDLAGTEMGQSDLVRWIDAVGGIPISLDEPLVVEENGLRTEIPPGRGIFDGDMALDYLKYGPGQLEGRMRTVLYSYARRLEEVSSNSSLSRLAEGLEDPLSKEGAEAVLSLLLNVSGMEPADISARTVISERPAPAPSRPLRVRILNGVGRSGLASRWAEVLAPLGVDVVETANADNFRYSETEIHYSVERERVEGIARLLGANELVEEESLPGADVVVILGRDSANR